MDLTGEAGSKLQLEQRGALKTCLCVVRYGERRKSAMFGLDRIIWDTVANVLRNPRA
jgi:hypothetical protein